MRWQGDPAEVLAAVREGWKGAPNEWCASAAFRASTRSGTMRLRPGGLARPACLVSFAALTAYELPPDWPETGRPGLCLGPRELERWGLTSRPRPAAPRLALGTTGGQERRAAARVGAARCRPRPHGRGDFGRRAERAPGRRAMGQARGPGTGGLHLRAGGAVVALASDLTPDEGVGWTWSRSGTSIRT